MEEYRKYEPIFGSWYLSRLIGKGSFGKVFEITREEYGTTYRSALKIITVPQDEDDAKTRLMTDGTDLNSVSEYYEGILRELVNENEIMAQLKGNSNIVSYEDHQIIPHEDGIGYDILIRMELLTPLLDRMAQGKLDEKEVVRLGIDICKALEVCHRKNIIHRDIKPQNIFISDIGDYKLGDFGIARTIEKTTGGMSKKGTYKYMAPEVYRGENYDHTVDLYSLGLVLFSLLNGNRGPFLPAPPAKVTHNDEEEARARRFRGEPLNDPKDAGAVLSMIIKRACAFAPQDRYRSAEDMRRDLESYLSNYGDGDYIEKTVAQFPLGGMSSTGSYNPVNSGSYNPVNTGSYDPVNQGGYSPVGRKTGSYNPVSTGSYDPVNPEGYQQGYNTGSYNNPYNTGAYNNPYNTGSYNNPYNTQNGIPGMQPVDPGNRGKSHKGILIVGGIIIVLLIAVIAIMLINMNKPDPEPGTVDSGGPEIEVTDNGDDVTEEEYVPYDDTKEVDDSVYDDSDEYIMPDADTRVYSDAEIDSLDEDTTQRAINELYARHGYIFHEDKDEAEYFNSLSWYYPEKEKVVPEDEFNSYEYKNYLKLVEHRKDFK